MDKRSKRKIPYTQQVLLGMLEHAGELYEMGMKTYRGPFMAPREIREGDNRREYQSKRELKRLKKIRVFKEGEQIYFALTEKGYLEALKAKIITKKEMMPEGDFCLVIFDVPEDIRKVRSAFRNLLKRADFYQVQKSVWESDRDVVEELRVLTKELKVEKYIKIYQARGER